MTDLEGNAKKSKAITLRWYLKTNFLVVVWFGIDEKMLKIFHCKPGQNEIIIGNTDLRFLTLIRSCCLANNRERGWVGR